MQIEEIVSKVKQLREDHTCEAQQETLNDLIKFRELLLEDIKNLPQGAPEEPNNAAIQKYEYRLMHLRKNFAEILEMSENEKTSLIRENEKLKYQIETLKRHVKID